jgi:transcriptional regulator with XRE-family HTH domain
VSPQIRARLIARRAALGMTQHELASLMGTTQSAVSDFESGRHDPRLSTLDRWARALGLRLGYTLDAA